MARVGDFVPALAHPVGAARPSTAAAVRRGYRLSVPSDITEHMFARD